MIKVISFDLDDTLTDSNFDRLIWDVKIPRIYAEKNNISFEKSQEYVSNEYKRLSGKIKGKWYDAEWWLKYLKLKYSWNDLLDELKPEIKHFPEVKKVLKKLKKQGYKLIIVTTAENKFMNAKLECEGLGDFFDKKFSTSSNFNQHKKNILIYNKILKTLKIKPEEMLHIGNHFDFDYIAPRKIGIKAVLIDRSGKNKKAIKELNEIYEFLKI